MTEYPAHLGEIRPSQLMFSYGIGAIIDLPKISVIVTGLEDWPVDPRYMEPVIEDRLLRAVRYRLPMVRNLLSPPTVPSTGAFFDPFDPEARIGVPVATFPRWMVCPFCHLLAPLASGLFRLKEYPFHPERTAYRHENCTVGRHPDVVPARFLATCERGHLDDFPWVEFVHQGDPCDAPRLRLIEYGPSGEARDLEVRCDSCGSRRRMAAAFGRANREGLPRCSGRNPHLRSYDPDGCELHVRPIILGASNTWFPVVYSTVAIPVDTGLLAQLVEQQWATLRNATGVGAVEFLRNSGQLGALSQFGDKEIWQAIEIRKGKDAGAIPPPQEEPDLKAPEWDVFIQRNPQLNSKDFMLRAVDVPERYVGLIEEVVLVERLREARAMVGFTRLDAVGELTDPDLSIQMDPVPLSRQAATWVPATEVRGEGIFIRFNEARIGEWLTRGAVRERENEFLESHVKWRIARYIEDPGAGFPGMRYVLIHSFAHALMLQLALECGYAVASIRERIYARSAESEGGPMAGVLIYTSAADSEGTLGGLVSLGKPEPLGRHISHALESARFCANDPLCAEHPPSLDGRTLHAAACHACMFAPETSCERGNKYLDRSTLVETVEIEGLAFFE